jgi:hypothetical protein
MIGMGLRLVEISTSLVLIYLFLLRCAKMSLDSVIRTMPDNGMVILVKEHDPASVAAVPIRVNTGYFSQPYRLISISHL